MSPSPSSPRRARENEEIMEALNRRMEQSLTRIRAEDELDTDEPLPFFCECSDLECRERVHVAPGRFELIHADSEQFILTPGHERPDIERVVDQESDFLIVRKIV